MTPHEDDTPQESDFDFVIDSAAKHSAWVGERLDRFLASVLSELSRSRIQALIKSGDILVDGRGAKPKLVLASGSQVTVRIPEAVASEALPQDIPLHILHEDLDLAVLDKAEGMVVHPAAGNPDGTLVNALLHRFGALSEIGGVQRPGIVHRLDKDTSGCMVVARNDVTHRALTEQFAHRTVSKIYLAVVEGTPARESGRVDTHIGRHPVNRQRMAVVQAPAGKHALTDYRVLATVNGDALVECTLHTGRTHQIRVHMKELGHPLIGDPIYAKPARQKQYVGRLMLHAWRLGFNHPGTRSRMNFEAAIPAAYAPWVHAWRG
ncbi:MAG: 23S rRNA pseudouridine1911/1915/1917 synthase [Verrucomicrobiales bacterium]|jgi:23S rRNA pseudouridine1911/1915/1917 synthase